MSTISKLAAKEKVVEVQYPNTDFYITIAHIPREKLQAIRNRSLKRKWDATKREQVEEVDNDTFLEEYSKAVIRGWKGLTVGVLARICAIDTDKDEAEAIEYSEEEALDLMKYSTDFDQWITNIVSDVERFSTVKKQQQAKNLKSTSETV